MGSGEKGRYLTALTFGNVHGVYKPGHVKLRPELLGEIQEAVGKEVGKEKPFDLVFHGGSGSSAEEIATAVDNGRSEEHTSELQSRGHIVCRLLLDQKNRG